MITVVVVALVAGAGYWAYRITFVGRFAQVEPGRLYRSRQPKGPVQYAVLFHLRGIKRDINLRSRQENPKRFDTEKATCRRYGVQFFNIPVTKLVPTRAQTDEFLKLVRTSPGPTLVHCQLGRNRTGMMCAVYEVAKHGVPIEKAIQEEMAAWKTHPKGRKRKELIALMKQYVKAPATRDVPAMAKRP